MEIKYIEYGSKDYKDSVELRIAVLRRPWNRDMNDEERAFEKEGAPIIGAFDDGKIAGVGVLDFIDKKKIEIKYMAVYDNYRGKGVGKAIMDEIENYCRREGYQKIVLEARTNILPFYEKRGYVVKGEAYIPSFVDIEHIHMEKDIDVNRD